MKSFHEKGYFGPKRKHRGCADCYLLISFSSSALKRKYNISLSHLSILHKSMSLLTFHVYIPQSDALSPMLFRDELTHVILSKNSRLNVFRYRPKLTLELERRWAPSAATRDYGKTCSMDFGAGTEDVSPLCPSSGIYSKQVMRNSRSMAI